MCAIRLKRLRQKMEMQFLEQVGEVRAAMKQRRAEQLQDQHELASLTLPAAEDQSHDADRWGMHPASCFCG